MQKLALVLPRAIPVSIDLIAININIKNNWKYIIHSSIYNFVAFDKAIFNKSNELQVIINVLGAAIMIVKTNEKMIISAIQTIIGKYTIRLCFQHTFNIINNVAQ